MIDEMVTLLMEEQVEDDVKKAWCEKAMDKTPSPQSTPSAQLRDYFNPIMAAALQAQQQQSRPATGPLIGGTPMVDTKVDLTVS